VAEKQTLEATSLNVSLGKYLTSLKQRLFWVKNEHQNGQQLQKMFFFWSITKNPKKLMLSRSDNVVLNCEKFVQTTILELSAKKIQNWPERGVTVSRLTTNLSLNSQHFEAEIIVEQL